VNLPGNLDWSPILLSCQVATLAATLILPPAIAIAWWLARSKNPARWLVATIVNLPLVLPPVVTGFLLLVLLAPRGWPGSWLESLGIVLVANWFAAVLAAAVVSFPLAVRAIQLAFQQTDKDLEAMARTLGAGPWTTFSRISLPLARRGLIAGWFLAFARSLGEFGATIMLAGNIAGQTRTIPLAIYSHANSGIEGYREAWPLVVVAVALAFGALLAGHWMERRAI
jgi:molybdate transport system permease protein